MFTGSTTHLFRDSQSGSTMGSLYSPLPLCTPLIQFKGDLLTWETRYHFAKASKVDNNEQ